mmetsp:Transcript_46139/g.74315  ORF Transcript_46139/g.74315 Transcript_46139/m.74315 type:complete len:225 (-) Transcript_46139:2332-3006(-)
MFSKKSHRPAAAPDFFAIMLRSFTCSNSRYGLASCTNLSGSLLSSISVFRPLRSSSMNLLTSFIICWAAFQSRAFFGSPFSARMASVTSLTPPGGLPSDLSSWRPFLSMLLRAASAFSTAGTAAARSRSQSTCIFDAASAITAVFAASSLAAAAAISTLLFSPPTTSATSSAFVLAISTSADLIFTWSTRIATSFAVASNLSRPVPRRPMLPSSFSRFCASMFL